MKSSSSIHDRKRILVCKLWLDDMTANRLTAGMLKYALSGKNWKFGHILAAELKDGFRDEVLAWKPDGLLMLTQPKFAPCVLEAHEFPVVLADIHHDRPDGVARITIDERAIGRMAARYYLKNRFSKFAVVTTPRNPPFAQMRMQGFKDEVSEEGGEVSEFQIEQLVDRAWRPNPKLEQWLQHLPKPVGVYCVNDTTVLRVMEHCERVGLRIPSEVSLLGTDNKEVLCTSHRPSVSSIALPLERMGYEAARLLDQLMSDGKDGHSHPSAEEWVQGGNLIERQSSSLRAIPDPMIAKAVNYLHDHVLDGVSIDDAAAHAGVNRRTLERGCREHLGLSPGQYIAEVKIEHAKRLLVETDLRMWEIAAISGMSPEYFNTLFRRRSGFTPNTYRKERTPLLRGV